MRDSPGPFDASVEEARLRAALKACPGVLSVASIRPHHKGGFTAVIDIDDSQFDHYIEHMKNLGWMNVL